MSQPSLLRPRPTLTKLLASSFWPLGVEASAQPYHVQSSEIGFDLLVAPCELDPTAHNQNDRRRLAMAARADRPEHSILTQLYRGNKLSLEAANSIDQIDARRVSHLGGGQAACTYGEG